MNRRFDPVAVVLAIGVTVVIVMVSLTGFYNAAVGNSPAGVSDNGTQIILTFFAGAFAVLGWSRRCGPAPAPLEERDPRPTVVPVPRPPWRAEGLPDTKPQGTERPG